MQYRPEFIDRDIDSLDDQSLFDILWDIASGTKNFGRMAEWDEWLLYLLPRILERQTANSTQLYEALVTALFNVYWTGIETPYPDFRHDLFSTVGLMLVHEPYWMGQDLALESPTSLSASLFFCLRFLRSEEIPTWAASILTLPGQHWHRRFNKWQQQFSILFRRDQIEEGKFRVNHWLEPLQLDWEHSDLLFESNGLSEVIPRANLSAFLDAVKLSA